MKNNNNNEKNNSNKNTKLRVFPPPRDYRKIA